MKTNLINVLKSASICQPIPTLFYGKHCQSKETSPTLVSSDTGTPARSQHRYFIYPLAAFQYIMVSMT